MKRIPRIKFPQRHSKPSSGSVPQPQQASTNKDGQQLSMYRSDVPSPPTDMAVGGKASLQPKRTPVSEREIEAVMLGGCF